MLIDATHAEETRVVVVDGNKVEEFDFESENKRQLAGNIYLAKVTRVEPSLQAAFVDYGGNRHGFLAFSEIHPDYYQIPVADREALMEEERAHAEAMRARDEEEEAKPGKSRRSRSRRGKGDAKADKKAEMKSETLAEGLKSDDAVETLEVEIRGMETIDLDGTEIAEGADPRDVPEGSSPMETVADTPVEEPEDNGAAQGDDGADAAKQAVSGDGEKDAAPEASVSDDAADSTEDGEPVVAETAAEDDSRAEDVAEGDAEAKPAEAGAEESASDEADKTTAKEAEAEDEDAPQRADATSKDDSIESVADEDDSEDIRPPRKPRARRYKIQEVIKVRQVLLVQVVKEERGNKGAALTTYLSLAGRYCVLMPNTARGGGISRKITNATDRKKLKDIAAEIDVPTGAGLIVRTAGAKRTKAEIKRDYEYLQRLWEQIRELTLKSIAPAKIYEEGDLIKRSIRDLYSREIDEVLVEGERGYRTAKDFMKMIMPSHAKNVQQYSGGLPLFARYQVESYLSSMFNPTVQLKSGGYIVIGVTEALVAIDVNSGRATKEASIEETALKTNLEAAEEVARQLRLRDLAGLIVIDFIDMDERKNNTAVEKRMKDKLKTDRARIQVGRISGFGLMEMSRQRLRPGMIEATTQPCPSCHGTGLIRSDDNMALSILRQIEEEGTRGRSREVLVRCPVTIANFLMNQKREHIAQIEARYGLSIRIEGDVHLVSPDFSLEKFKTATRVVPEATAPVVSVDTRLMEQIDADEEAPAEEVSETPEGDAKPKRKRRRRRRKSKAAQDENGGDTASENGAEAGAEASEDVSAEGATADEAEAPEAEVTEKPAKKTRTRTRSRSRSRKKASEAEEVPAEEAADAASETPAEETGAERAEEEAKEKAGEIGDAVSASAEDQAEATATEAPVEATSESAPEEAAPAEVITAEVQAEPAAEEPVSVVASAEEPFANGTAVDEGTEPELETVSAEPETPDPSKPKRRGWWSIGR